MDFAKSVSSADRKLKATRDDVAKVHFCHVEATHTWTLPKVFLALHAEV